MSFRQVPNVQARPFIEVVFIPAAPGLLVGKPFKGFEAVFQSVIKRVYEVARREGGLIADADARLLRHREWRGQSGLGAVTAQRSTRLWRRPLRYPAVRQTPA